MLYNITQIYFIFHYNFYFNILFHKSNKLYKIICLYLFHFSQNYQYKYINFKEKKIHQIPFLGLK